MKRILSIALYFASAILCTNAEPLTPQQALNRIKSSTSILPKNVKSKVATPLKLAYTQTDTETSLPGVYVFTSPDSGFVLASADDNAPALLGYGNNFDTDNMPANFRYWIEGYAQQVQYLSSHPESAITTNSDRPTIPTLITTQWNQFKPYNNLCPIDETGNRSLTGCVATAMAQIINYHKWPAENGIGTHSYEWNGQILSFDYSSTKFDWENMLDTYDLYYSYYTDEQANAVATLMYAAGVSVDMDYSAEASATSSCIVAQAFFDNFGYGANWIDREYFTTENWDKIIYDELAASRPVLYCGYSEDAGGHAFICDGYEGNSYYHINWGWGGTSDGAYLLSLLNPDGSPFKFTQGQTATIGIQPNKNNTIAPDIPLSVIQGGGIEYSSGNNAFWWGNGYRCKNYSGRTLHFNIGLKLVNTETEEFVYAKGEEITLPHQHGFNLFNIDLPTNLPAGVYHGYPVACAYGYNSWQKIHIMPNETQFVTIRVDESGNIAIDEPEPEEHDTYVLVTSISQLGDFIAGQKCTFLISLTNPFPEDIPEPLLFEMYNDEDIYDSFTCALPVKANSSATWFIDFSDLTYPDGKYYIKTTGTWGKKVSDIYPFYMGIRPKSLELTPTEATVGVGATTPFIALISPEDSFDKTITWTSDSPEIATVSTDGVVTGVAEGKAIITATTINGITATVTISVTDDISVTKITEYQSDAPVEYYNLQGVRVTNPTPGLYITRRGSTISKTIIQ